MNLHVKLVGQLASLFSLKCSLIPKNATYHQSVVLNAASKKQPADLPPKPKRPLTAYLQYMINQQPIIAQQNPYAKQTEIIRLVAQKWLNEDPALKSKLIDRFRSEQETYRTEVEKYKNTLTDDEKLQLSKLRKMKKAKKQRSSIKKKNKEFGKPKRPLNAFMLFLNDEKQAMMLARGSDGPKSKSDFTDLVRTVKQKWEMLAEDQKETYRSRAKLLQTPYELELLEWEEKMIADGHFDIVRKKNLQKRRE